MIKGYFLCSNYNRVEIILFITGFFFFSATNNLAFASETQSKNNIKISDTKIHYHKADNITNRVPYFDNRFRLDADLEEVTLIFYRKSGSTPIILIRPDGSKIRVNNFDSDKVEWFDDTTFDMIKINKPMPGPWQAVGDILPESHILIVSDVTIAVKPLPKIIFSGETLKVEGHLFNGNEAIKSRHFKDAVTLDVNFYTTNNLAYENFGADAVQVTSFRDDGYGLDEYAHDNTFTGEFVLDFAPGEWQPVYLIKLPMQTRELPQTPILLQQTPIDISVTTSKDETTPHDLLLTIDTSMVMPNSIVFQGKITFPDREIESFSIMQKNGNNRTVKITNTEPGLYRVNVSAFGETTDGREFRLVVPEFTFNVETVYEPLDNNEKNNTLKNPENKVQYNIEDSTRNIANIAKVNEMITITEQEKTAALLIQKQLEDEKDQENLVIIITSNLIILMVSIILFFSLRRKNTKYK
jgi:uncharacterized protein (TIGR03503 family)